MVQDGEDVLDDLLSQTQDDEEDEQAGQSDLLRTALALCFEPASVVRYTQGQDRPMTQTTDVPVVGSSGAPRMSYEDFLRHYEGSHKVEWLQQDPLPMLMTVLKAWNLV